MAPRRNGRSLFCQRTKNGRAKSLRCQRKGHCWHSIRISQEGGPTDLGMIVTISRTVLRTRLIGDGRPQEHGLQRSQELHGNRIFAKRWTDKQSRSIGANRISLAPNIVAPDVIVSCVEMFGIFAFTDLAESVEWTTRLSHHATRPEIRTTLKRLLYLMHGF